MITENLLTALAISMLINIIQVAFTSYLCFAYLCKQKEKKEKENKK